MNTIVAVLAVWGLVTLTLVALPVYRSRLTRQESDWIDLTDDAREDRAIQTQTLIEKKVEKLTWPIRGLSVLSTVLVLLMLVLWVFQGIYTPPTLPK